MKGMNYLLKSSRQQSALFYNKYAREIVSWRTIQSVNYVPYVKMDWKRR